MRGYVRCFRGLLHLPLSEKLMRRTKAGEQTLRPETN
ncbi:hypothetical protein F01_420266 [Burkholderia cenocepacia]|nr:hypothetical protein F01_420266 [Burkholderia cenocepacia]